MQENRSAAGRFKGLLAFSGAALVLILSGLAIIHEYASQLVGWALVIVGSIAVIAVSILAVRCTVVDSFWRRYFTVFTLFVFAGVLFWLAVSVEPEMGSPGRPQSPNITFVVGGDQKKMKGLSVKVVVWLDQWLSQGGEPYDCELATFNGPDVKSNLQWSVRVHASPGYKVMPAGGPERLYTTMKYQPKDPWQTYISFSPQRPLPKSPELPDQVSICWPSSKHLFVSERGSAAVIALSGVYVDQGETTAYLHGPGVKVDAILSGGENDWALDTGMPVSAGSGDVIRKWEYMVPTWGAVYMHSVIVRAHSVGEAADEHLREFQSGVLFGVGAAAFVAATTELFDKLT